MTSAWMTEVKNYGYHIKPYAFCEGLKSDAGMVFVF
jgi:hypothetical protein